MGLVGFNPDLVVSSINKVQNAYNELMQAVVTDMQNQFVNAMQDKWAGNDAQKFFASVKSTIDELINGGEELKMGINGTFESVVKSMNSAANAWAEQTGSLWSAKQFNRVGQTLDVSGIQENINGVRGVDSDAVSVANKLPSIHNSAASALANAQSAVQNCGFIGGEMENDLIASLTSIKNGIETAFNKITSECYKAVEIKETSASQLAKNVADAFAGRGE